MIRVGFVMELDVSWLGGVNYFRNLVNAIYCLKDRKVEVVIFTGKRSDHDVLSGFPPVEVVRSAIFDRMSPQWAVRKIAHRLFSRSDSTERLLEKNNIDVLSHSSFLSSSASIPAIGWIPDFQHVHLPEFFTSKELHFRNKEFTSLAKYCSKLILSSHDALRDLAEFSPDAVRKTAVLQFCVNPENLNLGVRSLDQLASKYQFTGKYFLLPNQFWAHKNHRLVVEALKRLKQEGVNVQVLATGNTQDYRQPAHFNKLMQLVLDLNLEDNFKVLGMLPLDDLVALMRHSLAIINPSLFEGWSTTVEEAKLLGVNVLLSDIAVHREQDPENAYYFSPNDPLELARHMETLWNSDCNNYLPEVDLYKVAVQRYREFASNYQNIVLEVAV